MAFWDYYFVCVFSLSFFISLTTFLSPCLHAAFSTFLSLNVMSSCLCLEFCIFSFSFCFHFVSCGHFASVCGTAASHSCSSMSSFNDLRNYLTGWWCQLTLTDSHSVIRPQHFCETFLQAVFLQSSLLTAAILRSKDWIIHFHCVLQVSFIFSQQPLSTYSFIKKKTIQLSCDFILHSYYNLRLHRNTLWWHKKNSRSLSHLQIAPVYVKREMQTFELFLRPPVLCHFLRTATFVQWALSWGLAAFYLQVQTLQWPCSHAANFPRHKTGWMVAKDFFFLLSIVSLLFFCSLAMIWFFILVKKIGRVTDVLLLYCSGQRRRECGFPVRVLAWSLSSCNTCMKMCWTAVEVWRVSPCHL